MLGLLQDFFAQFSPNLGRGSPLSPFRIVDHPLTTSRNCRYTRGDTRQSISAAPSSSGLGHRPFTAVTRVRVPLGSLFGLVLVHSLTREKPASSHAAMFSGRCLFGQHSDAQWQSRWHLTVSGEALAAGGTWRLLAIQPDGLRRAGKTLVIGIGRKQLRDFAADCGAKVKII